MNFTTEYDLNVVKPNYIIFRLKVYLNLIDIRLMAPKVLYNF